MSPRVSPRARGGAWLAGVLLAVSGCAVRRGPVQVHPLAPIDPGERSLVLLSSTPYAADLTVALGERGIVIRPLARAGAATVATTQGGDGVAVYEPARYGVQLDQRFAMRCALTPNAIYDFTLSVVDIRANAVVLVVRQTGADGPCSTVKPVWPTLADALARAWPSAPARGA